MIKHPNKPYLRTLALLGALALPAAAGAQTCPTTPPPSPAGGTIREVSPSGSDAAGCPAGATFRTLAAAAACTQPGDTVYLRAGTYTGGNALTLNGTASAPILIAAYPGEQAILDGNGGIGDYQAILGLANSSYVTVHGLEIRNTGVSADHLQGGYGIDLRNSHHITVQGNTIHDTARNGIESDGHDLTFDGNEVYRAVLLNENQSSPTFWDAAVATRVPGASADSAWANLTYRNNHIHDSWGEGLTALHVDTVTLEGNDVHDNYSVNIYVDNSRHVTLARNHSYSTSDAHNRTNDGGNRRAAGIQLSVEPYTHNGAYQGMELSDVKVINNVVNDTSGGIRFWSSPFASPLNTYSGLLIANNTVRNTALEAIRVDASPNAPGASVLENNIVFAGADGIALSLGQTSAWTVSHNLFPSGVPAAAQGAGNVGGDPLLASDGIGLQAGSPALGAGAPEAAVTSDFRCGPRNPASPSIGAGDASYALALGQGPVTLAPGQSVSLPVTTLATSGPALGLSLAVSGLPAGVSATLTPSGVTAGQQATLTLTADASAPATGPVSFSVTASGATGAVTASSQLAVGSGSTPAPAPVPASQVSPPPVHSPTLKDLWQRLVVPRTP